MFLALCPFPTFCFLLTPQENLGEKGSLQSLENFGKALLHEKG